MVSVSNIILQKCFKLYDDSSIYSNYSSIAHKYYKIYKENKDKKIYQENDKLKEDVKKWLFSQSLESRMKICTVENEFFGKILYQMIYYTKLDKTINFQPKENFYENENNNEQFTKSINNLNNLNKSENSVKITKTSKNGKKVEAPKLGYSQSSLDEFSDDEVLLNNLGNFLSFCSHRGNYTLATSNNLKNNFEKLKMMETGTEDFFKNILFFSVHHKSFPDCFTLSPEFLLEKEKFENYFSMFGSKNYFSSLIQSEVININNNSNINNSKNQKIFGYKLPDWFKNTKSEVEDYRPAVQIIIAFFEQVIMIKYLLNKNEKKQKIFSLLNENSLNEFFVERKLSIDYINKNYTKENKVNILNKLNVEEKYYKLKENKDKMKYVEHFISFRKNIGCEKNPYADINSINFNRHSNKWEEKYNKMNNITKSKNNIIINNNNNNNKNTDSIKNELTEKIKKEGCVLFVDFLLFNNYINLWKFDFFLKTELFEIIYNLGMDKNVNEILFDTNQTKPRNKKHRKKKKNNNNKKEEEKNNSTINNNEIIKDKDEYDGIFKTEEEKIYAPYYLNTNTEQKKLYHIKEMEEIKIFIAEEIVNGLLIDRIFLIPLNTCPDFYEKFKEEKEEEKIIEKNEIIGEEKNVININEIQKENNNDLENIENNDENLKNFDDDLSMKKSESMSITTQDTNNINVSLEIKKSKSSELKNEYDKEKEKENDNGDNNNDESNININNDSNNKNNNKQKKKKEKEQKLFLYDTVKKKKKKPNISTSNNTLISNEFNIITLKEPNTRLPFFDKLHNDIIKYETKVISLLNHGMKIQDFCITEIKRLIQETLDFSNDYTIEVYGSYATGLMIEASDIDIKIKLSKGTKADLDSFFKKVCEKLEKEKKFDEINPIETASVPVIKLLLSKEKFIKGKTELENGYKQFKESSLFKHYLFNIDELTKIKIDVTFILSNNNSNKNENNNINIENNNIIHDHDKSMGSEISSVSYVKEQITKYPEIKFIIRVLKRYFYYKKMNTAFLGGLSSYNLFLLLLSYAKFLKISQNIEKTNLGYFLFHFLYFFKIFDFKQYIININSENNIYDIPPPEKSKNFNFGKSIVIIDPLTGVNASKSSYKIDEIQNTFSDAFDFFQNEEIKYDKEGKTKVNKKNNNNEKKFLMGLPINNKNENNHSGGNIIEKFLGK